MDEELVGWLHTEGSGQWLNVQMDINDEVSLRDPYWDWYCLVSSSMIDSGTKRTLRKPANNTKLCGVADTPEEWNAIQKELDKIEKWAHGSLSQWG